MKVNFVSARGGSTGLAREHAAANITLLRASGSGDVLAQRFGLRNVRDIFESSGHLVKLTTHHTAHANSNVVVEIQKI